MRGVYMENMRYGSVLRTTNCYVVEFSFGRSYTELRPVYNMRQMADAVNSVVSRGGTILKVTKRSGREVRSIRAWHDLGDAYEEAYMEMHGGRLPY